MNGTGWRCRRRVSTTTARWCEVHLEWSRRQGQSPWTTTRPALAARLRFSRGYDRHSADVLSMQLWDPASRCSVCAVPNSVVMELWRREGPFKRGPANNNRRLTVDRIDPYGLHELANTRLACWPCNASRGTGIRSDGSVAEETRRWWAIYAPEDLRPWLADPVPLVESAVDLATVF